MMTFEEFQATRKEMSIKDFCEHSSIDDTYFEGGSTESILTYGPDNMLYIEKMGKNFSYGRYFLLIENCDWTSDMLESLERRLYDYATTSGHLED